MILTKTLAIALLLLTGSPSGESRDIPKNFELLSSRDSSSSVVRAPPTWDGLTCNPTPEKPCPPTALLSKRKGRGSRGGGDGAPEPYQRPDDDSSDSGSGSGTNRDDGTPPQDRPAPEREGGVPETPDQPALPPNRIPTDVPVQYRGLEVGGLYHDPFSRFITYEQNYARVLPRGSTYLFASGPGTMEKRLAFKQAFNPPQGKFHEEVPDTQRDGHAWTVNDIYDDNRIERLLDLPRGTNTEGITGAFFSYAFAKRAAQEGGVVRMLLPDSAGLRSAPLSDTDTFWTRFEWPVLTAPDSRVTHIFGYDARDLENNLDRPGTLIWSRDAPGESFQGVSSERTMNFHDAGTTESEPIPIRARGLASWLGGGM